MALLLVSVRSAEEARSALAGGASIIDVKEPANGPMGRASLDAWTEVRRVVPASIPLSAALGELNEWNGDAALDVPSDALRGFSFVKLALAGAGPDWIERWRESRARLDVPGVRWFVVAYVDWRAAGAPSPATLLDFADDFDGVLFDTWDKTRPAVWTGELLGVANEFRWRGASTAMAGGLAADRMREIAPIHHPDVMAVRGAACQGGDRRLAVDAARVAELAALVAALPAD